MVARLDSSSGVARVEVGSGRWERTEFQVRLNMREFKLKGLLIESRYFVTL